LKNQLAALICCFAILLSTQVHINAQDMNLLAEVGEALPGYQITFASVREGGNSDIWVINVDGTGERNLTGHEDGIDLYPEWGPNAEFIYYTGNKHGGTLELYFVNTVGEPQPRQITLLEREVRSISVSADNQQIALGVMSANVPFGEDLSPYSADMYLLNRTVLETALAEGRLITLDDLDLLLAEPIEDHIWYEQPHWQISNTDEPNPWLAYTRTQNYDNDLIMVDEIWLIRADGSEARRLTEGSMPRWSADSRFIVTHGFNVIDVATGDVRRLKIDDLSEEAGAASFSPDGQYLLFETDDTTRLAGIARVVYQDEVNSSANPFITLSQRQAAEPRWSPIPVPMSVSSANSVLSCQSEMFNKSALIFDAILICATEGVDEDKLIHAANVVAEWLDNDEDGQADESRLIKSLQANYPVLIMTQTGADNLTGDQIDHLLNIFAGYRLQDLGAQETNPVNGERDASQEEIHHLIINAGWQTLLPDIFSEIASDNSLLYQAWQLADTNGHYYYDDPTCDDSCKVTEFVYLATAAYLGAGAELDLASDEMRLKDQAALTESIPAIIQIFESEDYVYPIHHWPDGQYPYPENIVFTGINQ